MGSKLLWLGLTLIMATDVLTMVPSVKIVGSIIMIVGCILLLIDR